MALAEKLNLSVADYLQGELISEVKYEYINGEVYAMVGVKRAHDTVTTNLIAFLHAHLRGTSCRVHSGEMKVRVQTAATDCFFYPDLHVTCSASDTEELFNSQPKLIVEVLSDATERYDRAEKFHHYRKLASLEEYVLIAQDTPRVECYRRGDAWDLQIYQQGEQAVFQSLGFELAVADIYEGVFAG
ncbi:Uma2 family endonuclease [Methylomonas sp. MED-D]|uniref:Uma2 family endonuclease n=1 Tax=unclassified Methylomonas TaxID=2608980 RepID=UPI0028A405C0|nr:Uma2 family endonuclease [Methylomonas sp. MV1]MDT4332821.1 Uma2 family endonuclease [Methylomonas sp. MV1]